MKITAVTAIAALHDLANEEKARVLRGFFKTGAGQYGAGDKFLGITVPQTRLVARQYADLPLREIQKLLRSPIHEARLLALIILVLRYPKADPAGQKAIFEFYLRATDRINNWDLVDLSAPSIVGEYLVDKDPKVLFRLVCSRSLWERRIAVLATFAFIRRGRFDLTLQVADLLLCSGPDGTQKTEHDLIQKAVGWMLREVGKRDLAAAENFLQLHCTHMPRTALRYAIERFPEAKRRRYLSAKISRTGK